MRRPTLRPWPPGRTRARSRSCSLQAAIRWVPAWWPGLARPGGNATGLTNVVDSLAPKRIQLLREVLPGAKRVGLLGDPFESHFESERNALAPVALALGIAIIIAEASNPLEFDAAVSKCERCSGTASIRR